MGFWSEYVIILSNNKCSFFSVSKSLSALIDSWKIYKILKSKWSIIVSLCSNLTAQKFFNPTSIIIDYIIYMDTKKNDLIFRLLSLFSE